MCGQYSIRIFIFWRYTTINDLMINEQIRDKEVRLVGENGEMLGVMSAKDAMKLAKECSDKLNKATEKVNKILKENGVLEEFKVEE